MNQGLGARVGFLNPILYASCANRRAARDIVHGDNGAYHAGIGMGPLQWALALPMEESC